MILYTIFIIFSILKNLFSYLAVLYLIYIGNINSYSKLIKKVFINKFEEKTALIQTYI